MVRFLTSSLDSLPEYQKIAIDSLIAIKKTKGQLTSIRSSQDEILKIYNQIKGNLGGLLLNPRPAIAGSKISSADHNYNMETIFLDLTVLYNAIDRLGKSFDLQAVSLDSSYQKSKAAIQKLINDVKVLSLRKKYPEFSEIKVIDFNYSSNKSTFTPKAVISSDTRLLQLNSISDKKVHLENRDSKFTKIYTKTLSPGLKTSFSKSFPIESIVDKKPETFWTSFIMTDGPVKQKYTIPALGGVNSVIDVNGPIVEVYFRFSGAEKINYIRLLPFANFPVKILNISYKQTTQAQYYTTISDFNQVTTTDWEEYNFAPIYAVEIKISIAQENSSVVSYQIPEALYRNTDIFQKIYSAKLEELIGTASPDSDAVVEAERLNTIYEDAIQSLRESFRVTLDQYDTKNKIDYYYNFNQVIADLLSKYYPEINKETIFANYSREDLERLELIQVTKHEYLLGLREVEIGYIIYSPVGTFSSDKFLPQATIVNAALEVDERHTTFITNWENNYRKTSTEWSIDIGEGRVIPIHPKNLTGVNGYPLSKDEVVVFNQSNGIGTTRLGGKFSTVHSLKKNGQIVPETEYTVGKVTGAIPYLKIELTGNNWLDANSLYTTDYFVDDNSCNIQILGKFPSRTLINPETFTGTGPNNDIEVSKFPYIDYNVVNLPNLFSLSGYNTWTYDPPMPNQASGQIIIYPTIVDSLGNILQSGKSEFITVSGSWGPQSGIPKLTFSGNPQFNSIYFSGVTGQSFGYFLQVMDSTELVEITSFFPNSGPPYSTGAYLKNPIQVSTSKIREWIAESSAYGQSATGGVFVGFITGETGFTGYLRANFAVGICLKTEDRIYGLNNNYYTPITVEIEGKEVRNITNYATLQHPAFSVSTNIGTEYEFIQAGKKIYFNEGVNQEIKVTYNWVTDYIELQGRLRCNTPINPDLSPKVNEARLLINTTII